MSKMLPGFQGHYTLEVFVYGDVDVDVNNITDVDFVKQTKGVVLNSCPLPGFNFLPAAV